MPNVLPTPGTAWLRDATTWWVTAITQRGVLLHSETGQALTVPTYAWPADFQPQAVEVSDRRVLRALLIGGAGGARFERLWDQAAALDVDVDYHIPWAKDSGSGSGGSYPKKPLPPDIDLVILVPLMSHGQYWWYARRVKEEGLPMIVTHPQGFQENLRQGLRGLASQGKIPGLREEDYGAVPPSRRAGWWELSSSDQWVWREPLWREPLWREPLGHGRRGDDGLAAVLAAVLAGLGSLLAWGR